MLMWIRTDRAFVNLPNDHSQLAVGEGQILQRGNGLKSGDVEKMVCQKNSTTQQF
jgi:hypothetical protein